MTIDLTGKIALVTGGGNGIGAASCRALAEAGARIAVIDRDGDAEIVTGGVTTSNRASFLPPAGRSIRQLR